MKFVVQSKAIVSSSLSVTMIVGLSYNEVGAIGKSGWVYFTMFQ